MPLFLQRVNKMEKRNFKNIGEDISLLGFGCMRLPTVDGDDAKIDYEKAQQAIDLAYKSGVNYFDTAYGYHGGESENFVGKALCSRYPRESFFLADKMPPWFIKQEGDVEKIFADQQRKCRTEYFDFYLEHALNKENYEKLEAYHTYEFLSDMKRQGKIRHLGFSFHGDIATLKRILSEHEWDFVQIQYNYIDCKIGESQEQYDIIKAHGIPCIIMEPVRGGALANLNDEANAILKSARPQMSIASWAIRYAASQKNVMVVLSGMSSMEQVEDNLKTMSDFEYIEGEDAQTVEKAAEEFKKYFEVPCTKCHYCVKNCPMQIHIPEMLNVWSEYRLDKKKINYFDNYLDVEEGHRASRCIECGMCESFCPQGINIIEIFKKMKALNKELNIEN